MHQDVRTVAQCRTLRVKEKKNHFAHLTLSREILVNHEPVIRDMKVRTDVITHQFYSASRQSKVLLFDSQCMYVVV